MDEKTRRRIVERFEDALDQGYIQPYYQPVVRTVSGKLCSFEALARWIDPELGFLRPDIFISALEEANLIHLLDSHIIREVCRRIRRSVDSGETPIPVSVNLSRLDFTLCDVFSVVDQHVSEFQIPHDFLYIEITESVMGEEEGLMHTVVDRFHAAGYQVWMDDFGSGYSSLNMLKDYIFDELKLDMQFLRSFDLRSRRIMTSIIQMAKDIDIHTLAEGVETEEQYKYLRNVGCEKVQGYYIGKPMAYDDAIANLERKGISIELPRERKYYDDIGHVNFLSPSPFLSAGERRRDITGRQLNSIPLALVEMRKDDFTLLFANSAFEQNAGTTVHLPEIFGADRLGESHPFSVIPGRIINLIESTRSAGDGRMLFVSNEEYYELTAKCVARRRGAYCVLLQLINLSQESQSTATSVLDDGIRQIYTIFERITLIDLNQNKVIPLYTGIKSDVSDAENKSISAVAERIVKKWIRPEDREAFLRFWDTETMSARLEASGRSSISEYFRCKVNSGGYEWRQFILVRYKPGQVLELVRNAHSDLGRFTVNSSLEDSSSVGVTSELLWQNLLNTDVIRLFWKDRDRRFLGVNRGFLEFYGFKSDKELIGKNDEELGWHVHPDLFMNDEYRVINEGISIRNALGHCISNGENLDILATKTPLYDNEGGIVGMLGYFVEREPAADSVNKSAENASRDEMTGLLSSIGLRAQAQSFADEYYLRGTDFIFLHVSLDEMSTINQQYGYEFGDKVIIELGKKLNETFGTNAAVGRINGNQFVVIRQIRDKSELTNIRKIVNDAAADVREVDGIHITLYISLGYALFSESCDMELTAQSAEMRLLVDHDAHVPVENRKSSSSEFFRLYDNLPISYAVYKVHANTQRKVTDAELFYANHLFERRAGRKLSEMLGHGVRELFPELDENWYDIAGRSAMDGETVIDSLYFKATDKVYHITASQIIRPGFCSFTYQEVDQNGMPEEIC